MEFTREPLAWARYARLALGAWLVLSAIIWSHPASTATNTWIVGLIVIIASLSTMHAQPALWIDRTVAAGLVILSLPLARFSVASALNNILVAAALVWLSFAPELVHASREREAR